MDKAWYSYKGGLYKGCEPYFFDPATVDWVRRVEKNYGMIKAEMEQFMQTQGDTLQPYFNSELVSVKQSWKFGELYFWGTRNDAYCKLVPKTDQLLRSIPGFVTAGISVLAPHTDIHEHYGDTNTSIRGHLGLRIPAPHPVCGLRVGDQSRGWQEGKMLLFCDAYLHAAWNHSDEKRYVLIIDVLQPQFINDKKNICANVLSLLALQKLERKRPFVKRLPGAIRGVIRNILKAGLRGHINS